MDRLARMDDGIRHPIPAVSHDLQRRHPHLREDVEVGHGPHHSALLDKEVPRLATVQVVGAQKRHGMPSDQHVLDEEFPDGRSARSFRFLQQVFPPRCQHLVRPELGLDPLTSRAVVEQDGLRRKPQVGDARRAEEKMLPDRDFGWAGTPLDQVGLAQRQGNGDLARSRGGRQQVQEDALLALDQPVLEPLALPPDGKGLQVPWMVAQDLHGHLQALVPLDPGRVQAQLGAGEGLQGKFRHGAGRIPDPHLQVLGAGQIVEAQLGRMEASTGGRQGVHQIEVVRAQEREPSLRRGRDQVQLTDILVLQIPQGKPSLARRIDAVDQQREAPSGAADPRVLHLQGTAGSRQEHQRRQPSSLPGHGTSHIPNPPFHEGSGRTGQ